MRDVKPGDGLHFLSVPMTSDLAETYLPSTLTHDDYPELIEAGDDHEALARLGADLGAVSGELAEVEERWMVLAEEQEGKG